MKTAKKTISFLLAILIIGNVLISVLPSFAAIVHNDLEEGTASEVCYYYKDENTGMAVPTKYVELFNEYIDRDAPIEVVFQFNYEYPEYDSFIDDENILYLTSEEIDAELSDLRSYLHTTNKNENNRFLEEYSIDCKSEDFYITVCNSPFIRFVFDDYYSYIVYEDKLINASKDEKVVSLSISPLFDYEDDEATRRDTRSAGDYDLETAFENINADDRTYDGQGVKVGIIETKGVVGYTSHPELSSLNTTFLGSNYIVATSPETHPLKVARVLCGSNGTARSISALYSYQLNTSSYYSSLFAGMDWLSDNGCNVVNISTHRSSYEGQYTTCSALLDYFVRYENMSVVVSAGNSGENETNHYVSDFAVAFNTIGVGATDAGDYVNTYSSYGASQPYHTRYVTVVAPGSRIKIGTELIGTGTSFSAPIVTGVVARLMSYTPYLKTAPEIIIAALTASSIKVAGQTDYFDTYAGAGRIDFEDLMEASTYSTRFSLTNDSLGVIKTFYPTYPVNTKIKMSLFCMANPTLGYNYTDILTDYNLKLRSSNGVLLASTIMVMNHELLYYNNTSYTSFTAQIIQFSNKQTTVKDKGAVVWYRE